MTGCTCKRPGWCERHKMKKSPHMFQLCQSRDDYFDAWENGTGPGQRVAIRKMGLGDMVERGLNAIGITEERYTAAKKKLGLKGGCGCRKRKAKLNRLGRKLGIGR